MEIDPSLLHDYPAALDRAVRLLAERPRSRKEISDRLASARFDEEVIGLVLYKLEKENLLNDRDFAEQWVQSRSRKYGSSRISRELRMKGIDEDTASEVLENLPDDEQLLHATDFAVKIIRTRRSGEDPQKLKQRVTAAIVRRGYSWSIALKAYHCALLQEETNAD